MELIGKRWRKENPQQRNERFLPFLFAQVVSGTAHDCYHSRISPQRQCSRTASPGSESYKQKTFSLDLCSHKVAILIKPDRPA